MYFTVSDSGGTPGTVKSSSSSFADTPTQVFYALTYNESDGTGLFYKRGSGGGGTKTTLSISRRYGDVLGTVGTSTSSQMRFGASNAQSSTDWRFARLGIFDRKLSENELDTIWNRFNGRKQP